MSKTCFAPAALFAAALTLGVPAYAQAPRGSAPADAYPGVPPSTAYQGGAGSPFSPRASNIDGSSTTTGDIAPRLPDPQADGDDARTYLQAARRALARHQTGAAQEALERAQTRVMTRSTDPALADTPDNRCIARAIADARMALGQRDLRHAQAILDDVLAPRR